MLLGRFRQSLQVPCANICTPLLLLTLDVVSAFQVKEVESRRILKEVVESPTVVYTSKFSFHINSTFYAKSKQPFSMRQDVFSDANCSNPAPSSTDSPNPIVANMNECIKVPSSGPLTNYYKPMSCFSGGKAEVYLYSDASCSGNVGQISIETDKCIQSEKGWMRITCTPAADFGAFEGTIQNVTDSIISALETSLLLPKGALFSIPSDYQFSLPKLLSNQSDGFVVVERSMLLFSMNTTAPASIVPSAIYSHVVNSFRASARTDEIRNLVTPATLSVSQYSR